MASVFDNNFNGSFILEAAMNPFLQKIHFFDDY